jgi:hypothetical protein
MEFKVYHRQVFALARHAWRGWRRSAGRRGCALEGDGEILATTRRDSIGRAGVADNPPGATPGDRLIDPLDGAFARRRDTRVSPGSPTHDLAGRTFRSGQVSRSVRDAFPLGGGQTVV